MTAVVQARVFPNSYRDSVELMRIAAELESLDGVLRAGLVMATSANCEVLTEAGLFVDALAGAGPNDLAIAVSATDDAAAGAALELAASRLGGQATEAAGPAHRTDARTLAEAVAELSHADLVLVSTPGPYATAEAMKALKRGLHVFLFSDNVPLADEIELKDLARRKGLLLMGPDCGTAILDGVPLGFANAVRRGSVGLVAASGTGLQQVSCLVDRLGAGISQAIGVGGRDLDERVGGVMMLAGIERLVADPGTAVLVLISKPPADSVAKAVLEVAARAGKPVVVNFLGGDPEAIRSMGLIAAPTFEAAAEAAAAIALGQPLPAAMDLSAYDPTAPDGQALLAAAASAATTLREGQWRIRGLYSGGSLAGEAKLILKSVLGADATRHEILDLGDDEYTVGRPHPMIDPRLRNEHITAAGADPDTAVILLDVVLGYGSQDDPAGAMVPAIEDARAAATAAGRSVAVVASVCGTEADPQGLSDQERRLAGAGVLLAPSNARAARLAAAIAELAAQAGPAMAQAGSLGAIAEASTAGMRP
ncbi:MAG: acyl-CoA synthetase FdrA [Chloroflexota bacterium]